MKTLIALFLTLLTAGYLGGAEFTRESLIKEIDAMKTMLKDTDVEKAKLFIKKYSHPDELKVWLTSGKTLDALAKSFIDEGSAADLRWLLMVSPLTPSTRPRSSLERPRTRWLSTSSSRALSQ